MPGAFFSHTNDVGAAFYNVIVRAETPGGAVNYTAFARLRMLDSPGFAPGELPLPAQSIDFADVTTYNAPWLLPDATNDLARTGDIAPIITNTVTKQFVESLGIDAGTTNYADLANKPAVNGVTLAGDKTSADLGLADAEDVSELAGEVIAKYTKPQAGIPASDMTLSVRTSLGKADGAVQKTGDTMTGGLTVPNLTVGLRKEDSTIGEKSTAEGFDTVASGFASHAEGDNTVANSKSSHAEGAVTEASGRDSHAEGNGTAASGDGSHAEGRGTTASGDDSHAEGTGTTASGDSSHAEGRYTAASGDESHAEGRGTITSNEAEHAEGFYNVTHTGDNLGDCTQHTIGVGDDDEHRKNAVEVMYDGKMFLLGVGGYDGTNPTGQPNAANDIATVVNGKAPLSSPAFTGTPTAPTPAANDNSTKVATTAFVKTAISGISVTPLSGHNFDFATTQGVMDALKATIETLGGTVTNAPTPPAQNNQTQGE